MIQVKMGRRGRWPTTSPQKLAPPVHSRARRPASSTPPMTGDTRADAAGLGDTAPSCSDRDGRRAAHWRTHMTDHIPDAWRASPHHLQPPRRNAISWPWSEIARVTEGRRTPETAPSSIAARAGPCLGVDIEFTEHRRTSRPRSGTARRPTPPPASASSRRPGHGVLVLLGARNAMACDLRFPP